MKKAFLLLSIAALAGLDSRAQNLLLNGDFNSPNSGSAPDDWTTWTYGQGYSNHEIISPDASVLGNYDGTYQMTCGAADTTDGGGVYQIVSASAGLDYTLSVDAGAQDWWLPTGEIRLFFFDANNNQLGLTQIDTTDSLHNSSNGGLGDLYDTGVPYQLWSLSAVAPVGTTQAKVEFAGYGGGSCWFDNADLTVSAVPEAGSLGVMAGVSACLLALQLRRGNRGA